MPQPLLKNRRELATTRLRRDALAVLESGLRAIDTHAAVLARVKRQGDILEIGSSSWDLSAYRHVYVIAIGKAAYDASRALESILGARIADGIALDVKAGPLKRIKSIVGTHPFPSLQNMRATGEIIGILKHLDSHDLVITVVSGGGSALLCWPYQLKCDELSLITKLLMSKGASIQEINTVRKHLSEIQGGQFARLAFPATVIGLIFSDVPGDDLDVIASGPTVLDTTTVQDAQRILARYDILKECKMPECQLQETPKDPIYFRGVTNLLIVNNAIALEAMEKEAHRLGYGTRIYSKTMTGEAREVGRLLAGLPRKNEMVLAGGETTVTVRGKGKGGRNQELALGALAHLEEQTLVLSCASDGIDHTPVAGALVDAGIADRAHQKKLDPASFLQRNDAYVFFQKAGGALETGMTGANISDLMVAARSA